MDTGRVHFCGHILNEPILCRFYQLRITNNQAYALYYFNMSNVFNFLKHIFIPHHGNDFKPHFFREFAVGIMLFGSVFLLGSSFFSSRLITTTDKGARIASSVLVDLTNENRVAANERPLLRNPKLENAALLKGGDMANKEYFSHYSPEGVSPWHWFSVAGYTFLYAGENLAINFSNEENVDKAWLNSPKHKANILNGEFREIGIAAVSGMYNNSPTIYVVQMFGTPALLEIATRSGTSSLQLASSTVATIESDGDMLVVKNTSNVQPYKDKMFTIPPYSSWIDRLLFYGSRYIDVVYKVMTLFIAIALLIMIVVEIRKQHMAHIFYGIALLILLQLFMYINQSFF